MSSRRAGTLQFLFSYKTAECLGGLPRAVVRNHIISLVAKSDKHIFNVPSVRLPGADLVGGRGAMAPPNDKSSRKNCCRL